MVCFTLAGGYVIYPSTVKQQVAKATFQRIKAGNQKSIYEFHATKQSKNCNSRQFV